MPTIEERVTTLEGDVTDLKTANEVAGSSMDTVQTDVDTLKEDVVLGKAQQLLTEETVRRLPRRRRRKR